GATTGVISVSNAAGFAGSSSNFTVTFAPAITSFIPTSGEVGIEITLSGANFTGTIAVLFNGTPAASFNVDSDNQLRAVVPTGATNGPITVTNPAGSTTSAGDFTVTVPAGTTLTFNPTEDAFVRSNRVTNNYDHAPDLRVRQTSSADFNTYLKFNISGLSGSIQSATLKLFVIDSGSDGGAIYSVSNNFLGTNTPWTEAGLIFTNAPEITGSPLSSLGAVNLNETVEFDVTAAISGNGMVSFAISNNSGDAVKYSSKQGVQVPVLEIVTGSGSSNVPSITSFSPAAGPVGTEVTVTGNNFNAVSSVKFNGIAATIFTADSDTQLRANVPPGASTGKISVANASGTGTSSNNFTVVGSPVISSFSPVSGPVSTEVTIVGSNLSGLLSVTFNGTPATNFTLDSDSQVRANVPNGATTGKIAVSNAAGTGVSSSDFTVSNLPGIASFNPSSGTIATEVTITGVNFTGATDVSFNGVAAAPFNVDSDSQIRATVPASATTGKISVTTAAGTSTSTDDFVVAQPPTIASFTPTSGPINSEVTVTGNNFTGTLSVAFNNVAASNFTVDSNTQLRAVVPSGATTGKISVTNAAGLAASANDFTITSGSGTFTFLSSDDAYVRSSRPTENFGGDVELKVRTTSVNRDSYLKFNVTGLSGAVQSARVRMQVMNASVDGGSIYSVSNNYKGTATPWDESGLVWNNAPEITGVPLHSAGQVNLNQIVEFDVTAAILGNGTYSFAVKNASSDIVIYSSKEGPTAPEMVITTGSALPKQSQELAEDHPPQETNGTESTMPEEIVLYPNYPNPFNLETAIEYALPEDAKVKLSIFNLKGQLVRMLVDGQEKAGFKKVRWDGKNSHNLEVGTGVYFMQLEIGDTKLSKKITLQK
ncbi:MAG: IPT/TIG domain-containing protein, partial [bacterium]